MLAVLLFACHLCLFRLSCFVPLFPSASLLNTYFIYYTHAVSEYTPHPEKCLFFLHAVLLPSLSSLAARVIFASRFEAPPPLPTSPFFSARECFPLMPSSSASALPFSFSFLHHAYEVVMEMISDYLFEAGCGAAFYLRGGMSAPGLFSCFYYYYEADA